MTIDVLAVDRCLSLLRTVRVGRLALIVDDEPEIYPVNYAIDHGAPVFRTAAGTKLAAVDDHRPVAFEADGRTSGDVELAWSVVIKGRAHRMHGTDLIDTETLELWPAQEGAKPTFVRIEPVSISGRSFPVVDPAYWETEATGIARQAPE